MNHSERLIKAISDAMKKQKVTGKMIEEYTGVSQTTVSMWKKGYQPKFDNAVKVMQYLGIHMADILDITGKSEQEMRLLIAQNYVLEIRDSYERYVNQVLKTMNSNLQDAHKLFAIEKMAREEIGMIKLFYSEDDVITGQYIDQFIPEGFIDDFSQLREGEKSRTETTELLGANDIKMVVEHEDGSVTLENIEDAYNWEHAITLWVTFDDETVKKLKVRKGEIIQFRDDNGCVKQMNIESFWQDECLGKHRAHIKYHSDGCFSVTTLE